MSDLDTVVGPTDQTSAADAGHTTTEYALTKLVMICGIIIASASEVVALLGDVTKMIPPTATGPLHYVAIAGTVVTFASKVAYLASRTLIKMKLVSAQDAKAAGIPDAPPGDPAAAVLGADAPSPEQKS